MGQKTNAPYIVYLGQIFIMDIIYLNHKADDKLTVKKCRWVHFVIWEDILTSVSYIYCAFWITALCSFHLYCIYSISTVGYIQICTDWIFSLGPCLCSQMYCGKPSIILGCASLTQVQYSIANTNQMCKAFKIMELILAFHFDWK